MRLFVDTGAWFALVNDRDQNHVRATGFAERFGNESLLLYTTDYVIDEAATMIRLKLSHRKAVDFLNWTAGSASVTRAHVAPDLLARGEEIFRKYRDKEWSYTDCVSFAYMDEMGLEDAFAFDRNFSQYGKRLHP